MSTFEEQFELVDESRSVGREVRDKALFHQIDQKS